MNQTKNEHNCIDHLQWVKDDITDPNLTLGKSTLICGICARTFEEVKNITNK